MTLKSLISNSMNPVIATMLPLKVSSIASTIVCKKGGQVCHFLMALRY